MRSFHESGQFAIHLNDLKVVASRQSSVSSKLIRVATHPTLGKVLFIGKEIQHVEAWAPIYHEHIVHFAASFIPGIESVLILGGGSLYAAQEILKYPSVRKVVLVDHDKNVLAVVAKHYHHAREVLADERMEVIYDDALSFIAKSELHFDLIVNDAIDFYNLTESPKEIYRLLVNRLAPRGACCDLVYRSIFEKTTTKGVLRVLRNYYRSAFSLVAVPEYPGILHLLTVFGTSDLISQSNCAIENALQQIWLKTSANKCIWYGIGHKAFYLYLPPYIRRTLGVRSLTT